MLYFMLYFKDAGEVRQSDGLSYRLCRVSVAKDGPSEALALYDL